MTKELRALVYGVGAMGSIVTRLLVERGVKIVGAVGQSPEKLGRDLGEVAGLGRSLGVEVVSDPRKALESGADIAVVCVGSYLQHMQDHFAVCLEHGVNVVTTEEETVFPWSTAPEIAAKLDALAKENGVTLAASGAQDVFWVHLVGTLLGASHTVDSVKGRCTWNVNDFGPHVAKHVHVGDNRMEFEKYVSEHGWPEFVARQNLEAIVSELGLTVAKVTSDVAPVVATESVRCESLNLLVQPGEMIGTMDKTRVETNEGPTFELSMQGYIYSAIDTDTNEWIVAGEPELHLTNSRANYRFTTCSSLVNRIPDVIRAEPGLLTLDQLGKPSFKHGSLAKYL
ncbi:MAG: hypothetical protein N2B03_07875 [Boseongicola sp.]